ncbi:MAG: phosphatidate cytidylyltransferase [Treponema sp.]|nr:phosphatidate cytidylyltransferase [Treponema sp.]
MKKLIERLIIFFVGVPVVLALVYLSYLCHLPLNIVICGFSAFAAYELSLMFGTNGQTLPRPLLMVLTPLVPLAEYLNIILGLDYLSTVALVAASIAIFTVEIFTAKEFAMSNARIARSLCVVLYAGFLPSFITRISGLEFSFARLATFLVLVFISDSAAWLFGMLFGKNNRGVVLASPNKSVAGFFGAYAGSFVFGLLMVLIVFKKEFSSGAMGTDYLIARIAALSVCVCSAAIIGDLAESVFKRSAEVKDSGNVVLGRGGVLDSVDSIFMAAPVYFFLVSLLFK